MPIKYADVQNEYNKDPKLKPEDVKALKEWVDMQPHLPQLTELQTILFLQSCYYSNEAAKNAIDTYFTVKTLCPDLFGNRNPDDPQVRKSFDVALFSALPKLTPEGYQVLLIRLIDCVPDHYVFNHQVRNFDMLTMLRLNQKGTANGHIIAIDLTGVTFGHVTKLSLVGMKKFLYHLQEGMPLRLKALHYFNVVPFMDKIMAFMKPFMKKELMDVLHLHENVDSLTKFIPRECLPQDYGGSVDPVNILHENYKQALIDHTDYFKEEEKQVVDESRRPGKPKNVGDVFGVEGTFKKLQVD